MTSSYPLPSTAGFDTGATWPTASEYFKYVSIDATTTRASTVMRSMPTSETRTHASMTIPLSRTRSRTSMRLVPPAARSRGIGYSFSRSRTHYLGQRRRRTPTRQLRDSALQHANLFLELLVFGRQHLFAGREVMVEPPPVEADLLRLVDRTNQQPDAN